MNTVISGLYMIILLQKDLKKAVDFYTKLGFKCLSYREGQWAEMSLGFTILGLCPVDQDIMQGHTGIVFEVADVNHIYAQRESLDLNCVKEPIDGDLGTVLTCVDPSGNRFDLYQPKPRKCCKEESDAAGQGCCEPVKTSGCC